MGVDAVFNPGSTLSDILARIQELATARPPRDLAALKRLAKRQATTVSEQIRRAIRGYVKSRRR